MALFAGSGSGAAQTSARGFTPLLADPREPAFFAAYHVARSNPLASRLGTVGFGQTIDAVGSGRWGLGITAGAFSQFNMGTVSHDLINTDYIIGLPVTYRRGAFGARFRLYHKSSHIGDEHLIRTATPRVDLSYESAELLVSHRSGGWRAYVGAEHVFRRSRADLGPRVAHGGAEYRAGRLVGRIGSLGARFVAAVHAAAFEGRSWQTGWSLVSGLELGDPAAAAGAGWRWSALLRAYTGPAPFGQFYRDRLTSLGFALGVAP